MCATLRVRCASSAKTSRNCSTRTSICFTNTSAWASRTNDELEQAQRVAVGDTNELMPLRTHLIARFRENFLKRRQHESDRRAELMTDVEKNRVFALSSAANAS